MTAAPGQLQLIGVGKAPLSKLQGAGEIAIPLRRADEEETVAPLAALPAPRQGQSTVTLYLVTDVPPHKHVFFIRHGESRCVNACARGGHLWNAGTRLPPSASREQARVTAV